MKTGFSLKYFNGGTTIQPNAQVNLELLGPGGFRDAGISSRTNLPIGAADSNSTIRSNYSLSGGTGLYQAKMYCTSDCVLVRSTEDTITMNLEVSDTTFSRDNGTPRIELATYYNPSVISEFEYGTIFELTMDDTLSSVSVFIDKANARRTDKKANIQCNIYRIKVDSTGNVVQKPQTPIFSSKKIQLGDLYSSIGPNGNWITIKVARNDTAKVSDTLSTGAYLVSLYVDQVLGTDTFYTTTPKAIHNYSPTLLRQRQLTKWGNWSNYGRSLYIRLNVKPTNCPLLNGSAISTNTSACRSNTGTATAIDPTNGSGPYRYVWNTTGSPTSKSISNLAAGIYELSITDTSGCRQEVSITIRDTGAPVISNAIITNVTCFGMAQGKICFNLGSGSSGPGYTFSWYNSNGSQISAGGKVTQVDSCLNGMEPGKYKVEVTDKSTPPCMVTRTYEILGPAKTLGIDNRHVNHVACFGDTTGSITIVPKGGTSPISVQWPSGRTGKSIDSLTAGIRQVTITDANGCSIIDSIEVTQPPKLVLAQGNFHYNSSPRVVTIVPKATGGSASAGYLFTWTNSSGDPLRITGSRTGEVKIGEGMGLGQENNGVYCVTVQDDNGCTASKCYAIDTLNTSIIEGQNTELSLNVFPNPNRGAFRISVTNPGKEHFTIVIRDNLGQVVRSMQEINETNYSVSLQLEQGIYFLSMKHANHNVTKKIISQ
tara:strand:- start:12211 stop:14346 length:2136 start_codon:yes stop_codon:yes gene_type:complete